MSAQVRGLCSGWKKESSFNGDHTPHLHIARRSQIHFPSHADCACLAFLLKTVECTVSMRMVFVSKIFHVIYLDRRTVRTALDAAKPMSTRAFCCPEVSPLGHRTLGYKDTYSAVQ